MYLNGWLKEKKYLSGEILNELIGLMSRHVMVEVFFLSYAQCCWYTLIAE